MDSGQRTARASVVSRMNTQRMALLLLSWLLSSFALASDDAAPETIVRAYATTWNAGDLDGFLALQDPDIQKYLRDDQTSAFKLTTSGREAVRQKYAPLFAKASRVKVEIVSVTTLGEIVVTRDHVTNDSEGYVSNELTMYQVRNGKIVNIWYLGRAIG
jgi:hypothetical protein